MLFPGGLWWPRPALPRLSKSVAGWRSSAGAAALGKRFRWYSIATVVIVLACGAVTGTYAADVQADLPTPWVGIWERISIAAFMAWIVVLATALLRARQEVET